MSSHARRGGDSMNSWPDALTVSWRMIWSVSNLNSVLKLKHLPYSCCYSHHQGTEVSFAGNLFQENRVYFTFTLSLKFCLLCCFSFPYWFTFFLPSCYSLLYLLPSSFCILLFPSSLRLCISSFLQCFIHLHICFCTIRPSVTFVLQFAFPL